MQLRSEFSAQNIIIDLYSVVEEKASGNQTEQKCLNEKRREKIKKNLKPTKKKQVERISDTQNVDDIARQHRRFALRYVVVENRL